MTRNEVFAKLSEIFADLFMDDDIQLTDATTADQVDGWDSLTNINLMLAVEAAFKLKFEVAEIEGFRNVGDLVNAVLKRSD